MKRYFAVFYDTWEILDLGLQESFSEACEEADELRPDSGNWITDEEDLRSLQYNIQNTLNNKI